MRKRHCDTDIYEQSWYLNLSLQAREILRFLYSKCDDAGVWSVDLRILREKTGIKNLKYEKFLEYINEINTDYDESEKPIPRERIVRIGKKLWITGYVGFQKGKNGVITLGKGGFAKGSLQLLSAAGLLSYSINKKYFILSDIEDNPIIAELIENEVDCPISDNNNNLTLSNPSEPLETLNKGIEEVRSNNKKNFKKEEEKKVTIEQEVFEHWNEQEIVKHKKLDGKTKRKLFSKLKDYKPEEIKQSISNYAKIVYDENCFFKYKWTLVDFLQRGIDKFLDFDVALNNYQSKEINNKSPGVTQDRRAAYKFKQKSEIE